MKNLIMILSLALILSFGCSKNEKSDGHDKNMADESGEMAMHDHSEMHADSLYTCSMHNEFVSSDAKSMCPECKMALKPVAEVNPEFDATAVEMHACPMHKDFVTTDKDGVCPKCKGKISDM